ncbi:MAG: alpha/beta fold hydrolase [Acidimicrobiaceae bacterium]|nr:alpha/beta fold hydrolase [Acidimicrobiaceae bacterium]
MIVDLHAETVGTGPAVLLVHGMGDNASGWAAAVAGLKDEFACTTIDLPGHGRSPAPAERAAYERESVLASMDAALTRDGAAPGGAVFVGHSLGGYLGLAHCLTRPGVIRGFVTPVASSATDDTTNGSS